MKIVFVHNGPQISGESIDSVPLGGTETAVIAILREMARQGAAVHIYTNTENAKIYDGVNYFPIAQLAKNLADAEIDVFISLRQFMPFWLPVRYRLGIYYTQDAWNQPFLHGALSIDVTISEKSENVQVVHPSLFMDRIHKIFVVGSWQAETLASILKFDPQKIYITQNGHFPERFSEVPLSDRGHGLIYTSTPFRGLVHLPEIYRGIKNSVPEASLSVCSSMQVYGVSAQLDNHGFGNLYREIESLPQSVWHGSIDQITLSRMLCRHRVFVYPNTFEETFCVAALEAQAAGLPIVASNKAALKERVTDGVDGYLIDGEPGSEEYNRKFENAVTALLTDDALWIKMSRNARQKASQYTYDIIARAWLNVFENELTKHRELLPLPVIPEFTQTIKLKNGQSAKFEQDFIAHIIRQGFALYGYKD